MTNASTSSTCSVPQVGGRLRYFRKNWQELTTDPIVIRAVTGYKIEFDVEKIKDLPELKAKRYKRSVPDAKRIQEEIISLHRKDVIELCVHEEGKFISNIFTTPKKNWRCKSNPRSFRIE